MGGLIEPLSAAIGAEAKPAGGKSCILVYLLGGPPHLDTFDLKPDAPAEIRGPFQPIATSVPGVQICEHLPRLARTGPPVCAGAVGQPSEQQSHADDLLHAHRPA